MVSHYEAVRDLADLTRVECSYLEELDGWGGDPISTLLSSEAYVDMCGHHHPPHGAPISARGIQATRSADSATLRSCLSRTTVYSLTSSIGCPAGNASP